MNSTNLRVGASGNPAQGPHPDLVNPMPSPTAGEDFPDPLHEQPAQRPQDQPDLDAFAARMGTDRIEDRSSTGNASSTEEATLREDDTSRDEDTSREEDAGDSTRDWRTPVATALGGLASGVQSAGERLKGVSEKLVAGDDGGEIDRTELRQRVAKVRTVIVPNKLRQLVDVAKGRVGDDRTQSGQPGAVKT